MVEPTAKKRPQNSQPCETSCQSRTAMHCLCVSHVHRRQNEFIQMMGLTAEDQRAWHNRVVAASMEEMESDIRVGWLIET